MTSAPARSWIRRLGPEREARVRLLCFPHAGGTAASFHGLAAALPPSVEVLAVQYPGRQDRLAEPPLDRLCDLAEQIAGRLSGRPGPPMVLFGHSMGAVVAFETARRLRREPAGLIVSGHPAPSAPRRPLPPSDDDSLLAELRELDGTDPRLLADPEMRGIILRTLRADYRAAETYEYVPGPPLRLPLSAMIGDADPAVTVAGALTWRAHTSAWRGLRTFPGGHFYFTSWPRQVVDALLADIRFAAEADLLAS